MSEKWKLAAAFVSNKLHEPSEGCTPTGLPGARNRGGRQYKARASAANRVAPPPPPPCRSPRRSPRHHEGSSPSYSASSWYTERSRSRDVDRRRGRDNDRRRDGR